MTRPTVHIPPGATPMMGPARKSIQTSRAPAESTIATSHNTITAASILLGPILSVRNPKITDPTTAKTEGQDAGGEDGVGEVVEDPGPYR
jgi:hypothetical protein